MKNFAWGKLYKSDLIHDLFFPVGKFFEDSFWQHLVMDRVERYGIIDEPLYYYRQRNDSISGMPSNRLSDLLEGNKERLIFIHERYPALYPLMRRKYDNLYSQMYPSQGITNKCKRFLQRVLGRLRPSVYKKIDL